MSKRGVPDWLTRWEYAHRGLHSEGIPENSLAAAEAAIAAGMGVECDIQMSRDGVPMVFHDWELDRLAGRRGLTAEQDADDLAKLKLLGTQQHIPTLTDLLALLAGKVPLLIEIKSKPGYPVEQSCEAVASALVGYAGDFAIMSFDPRVAAWVRQHSLPICCGLVMREDTYGYTQTAAERFEAFDYAQPDFLAYHIAALPNSWVAGLREEGLPILTWTVNSPEARERALQHTDALVSEGKGLT